MTDHLVTIKTFSSAEEAHLGKSRLAAKHIDSEVSEETASEMVPGGGMKLLVREADAARAAKFLSRWWLRKQRPHWQLPGDQIVSRAFNAATLGLITMFFFFFTGIALRWISIFWLVAVAPNLYSAILLLRLKRSGLQLSIRGRVQVREARLVNRIILAGATVGLVIAMVFLAKW